MAVFTSGIVDLGDLLEHELISAGVITLSITLGGASEASGAVAVVTLVQTAVAVPNLPSPGPFTEAAEKWRDVAEEIRTARSDLHDLISENAGVDDSWKGPGADALVQYVNSKILPAMDALAECADQAATTSDGISDSLFQAVIIFFAVTTVAIIFCLAANALNAIPFVGPALAAAAKWYMVFGWIGHVAYDIYGMITTLFSMESDQAAMEAVYQELADLFGTEGDRLDSAALERARQEVAEVIGDTCAWNKE